MGVGSFVHGPCELFSSRERIGIHRLDMAIEANGQVIETIEVLSINILVGRRRRDRAGCPEIGSLEACEKASRGVWQYLCIEIALDGNVFLAVPFDATIAVETNAVVTAV
jgi:hypothetical protein